jgi:predicted O-methyltransferase YrrM
VSSDHDAVMKHNESVTERIAAWLEALHARHVAPWRPKEFTHALQALSVRYVERRRELGHRSPLDSAGKRAAFAAFYAPLHFLTVRRVLDALAPDRAPSRIADLGCGTGVAGAAWALPHSARVIGVDNHRWAVDEARWNWRALGLEGRATAGDLLTAARGRLDADALVLAWAVNELDDAARAALLPRVMAFAQDGAVLILEPLARGAAPWWPSWAEAFTSAGGRADEWKFPADLPPMLRELSQRAGFRRDTLSARTLWLPGRM